MPYSSSFYFQPFVSLMLGISSHRKLHKHIANWMESIQYTLKKKGGYSALFSTLTNYVRSFCFLSKVINFLKSFNFLFIEENIVGCL